MKWDRRRRIAAGLVVFVMVLAAVLVLQRGEERRAAERADVRLLAFAAYDEGRHDQAVAGLATFADAGDAAASLRLARLYAEGLGVSRDPARARTLYERAAEAGLVEAFLPLARMLEAAARRSGEARDWEAARGAYQQAFAAGAVAGAGEAATRLADLHAAGDGTPASDLDAAAWYRRGAEARDPMAQLRLGLLYVEGRGVPQDLVRAHAWLNVAAATLPASQAQLRETAIVSRDAVERRLSRAERAEARRLAHELFG